MSHEGNGASRATPGSGRGFMWAPFKGMQAKALAATEFEVLIGGAKGPGKSDVLLMGATRQTGLHSYKAYIFRETGPQLIELIDRSHRLFPRLPSKPQWNGSERRWRFPNDTFIAFEAVGTAEEAARIQGKEPSYVGHDEIGNVPDERVADIIQAEIRCPNPKVIPMWRGSANPGKAGHAWLKRRFIDKCGKDGRVVYLRRVTVPTTGQQTVLARRFIPGTVLDNPVYANDARYMAQLMTLPEMLRRQLLYGDWDAGSGAALSELGPIHMVEPFEIPPHWPLFGAFDWGFAHNWTFGWGAATEDGDLFLADTIWGRRQLVPDIARRIRAKCPRLDELQYIHTDSAAFQRNRSRQENTPTIAEEMLDYGIVLSQGNTDRRAGLNNLRHYLAYKGLSLLGGDTDPGLRLMDTPGNRRLYEQLESIVVDPDDPEDSLKVNADVETGEGGDDGYDMLRLWAASRPPRAIGEFFRGEVTAFSRTTLAHMHEKLYRDNSQDHDDALHELSHMT